MSVEAVIAATAPGRAGIIGNPSDMYGGSVISCTLPVRARAALSPAPGCEVRVAGERLAVESAEALALDGGVFDIARAALWALELDAPPLRIEQTTTIPMQAGLGGSTALLAATMMALLAWSGREVGPYRLAERVRAAELDVMGVSCGYQDAYMTTFGGLSYLDFCGKANWRGLDREPYGTVERLDPWAEGLPFVVAHTGVQRVSGAVHGPIRERWLAGERAVVEGQRRIAELARLGKLALVERRWEVLGALMDENHAIQSELGGSAPKNDELIALCRGLGAWGAKLAGAGGGGTIIALHPEPQALKEPLVEAGATLILGLEPAAGAHLEDRGAAGMPGA